MLGAETNGYLAVALGVGLTGLFSLVAWIVLQIGDVKQRAAANRAEIEALNERVAALNERVARIEAMLYRPAWSPKEPPDPPSGPSGPTRR